MTKQPDVATERRAHRRVRKQIEMQGSPDAGGVVARMVTNDLSIGGLHCVSTADFPEMTRLEVRLMLPLKNGADDAAEPVDLEAVVVRRQEYDSPDGEPRFELALFFTGVENGARERLARYLDG